MRKITDCTLEAVFHQDIAKISRFHDFIQIHSSVQIDSS